MKVEVFVEVEIWEVLVNNIPVEIDGVVKKEVLNLKRNVNVN